MNKVVNRLANLEKELASARLSPATSGAKTVSSPQRRKKKSSNRKSSRQSKVGLGSRREAGTDVLASVTIAADSKDGSGIVNMGLSPINFPGTRWNQVSRLWARWRPVSLRLRLVSGASAMTSGRHGIGWVGDPTEDYPVGSAGVTNLTTLVPHQIKHVYEDATIQVPSGLEYTQKRWLELRGSQSDNHGTVIALLVSSLTSSTGSVSFQVHLDWVCEFDSPDITPVTTPPDYIQCEDGWEGYFTDSISDWASGTKLTLKFATGGKAVPFRGIKPNTIYQIDPRAKLPYYYGTNSKAEIKYGVQIKSYTPTPTAMAMFADLDQAKNYVTSGDTFYCLTYTKAGEAVVPKNPAWYPIWTGELPNNVESFSQPKGFAFVTGHKPAEQLPPLLPRPETIDPQQGDWFLA